jgi:hypothetical protein
VIGPESLNARLRLSGLLATGIFFLMAVSDVAVAFLIAPHVPPRVGVVLDAAGWNLGGVAAFALSTTILWNRRQ